MLGGGWPSPTTVDPDMLSGAGGSVALEHVKTRMPDLLWIEVPGLKVDGGNHKDRKVANQIVDLMQAQHRRERVLILHGQRGNKGWHMDSIDRAIRDLNLKVTHHCWCYFNVAGLCDNQLPSGEVSHIASNLHLTNHTCQCQPKQDNRYSQGAANKSPGNQHDNRYSPGAADKSPGIHEYHVLHDDEYNHHY